MTFAAEQNRTCCYGSCLSRRITSADFQSFRVPCCHGGFASLVTYRASALAHSLTHRTLGSQRRGPTRRSTPFPSVTGRCAMKPRSAGHLER